MLRFKNQKKILKKKTLLYIYDLDVVMLVFKCFSKTFVKNANKIMQFIIGNDYLHAIVFQFLLMLLL
ncbi:hypothetical protein NUSPORA_02534 [Nucleospora cyclopteri]